MNGDARYIINQAKIAQKTDSEAVREYCLYRIYTNSEPDDPNFPADGTLSQEQRQVAEKIAQEALNND